MEDGRWKLEDGSWKTEVGRWKLEDGNWKTEVGRWKLDIFKLMELLLTRTYFPDGTNGRLEYEGKLVCYTIELPWKNNETRVSCIPEGKYFIKKRYSPKFNWHLEVENVAHRSLILFHPANYALRELKGCIAPVTTHSAPGMGLLSRKAFSQLKDLVYPALDRKESVVLHVVTGSLTKAGKP